MYITSKVRWIGGTRVKEYAPPSSEIIWDAETRQLIEEAGKHNYSVTPVTVLMTYHFYRIPRIIKK